MMLEERKSNSWQKKLTGIALFHFESWLIHTIRKGYIHTDLSYTFSTKVTGKREAFDLVQPAQTKGNSAGD